MSGVAVLGVLWAAAGIWLGSRWWTERGAQAFGHAPQAAARRFGQPVLGGPQRRAQAMRLAYATGATAVAGGLLVRWSWLLAAGAAMVNLGTLYRHLLALVDELPEPDEALAPQPAPPQHRRARRPAATRILLGQLAD
jgi:hypothetical protein